MRNGTAIQLALTGTAAPHFNDATHPAWSQHVAGPKPYLDTSAVYVDGKDEASIRVAVVNRHPELALGAVLRFPETAHGAPTTRSNVQATYTKYEVWAADLGAANTLQNPDAVGVVESTEKWEAGKPIVFKEHSFTLCVFTLKYT